MADNSIKPEILQAQYTDYMTDVGNIGTRYSTSQAFYMSVVSALVGVFAYVAKDGVFRGHAAVQKKAPRAVEKDSHDVESHHLDRHAHRARELVNTERMVPMLLSYTAAFGAIALALNALAVAFGFAS